MPIHKPIPVLYLASASIRRAELLRQIGVQFDVFSVDIDESWRNGEGLDHYVARLAASKARAAQQALSTDTVILAADTAGMCNNQPLVKPRDEEDAIAMLIGMSGKMHTVSTAISICGGEQSYGEQQETLVVSTNVFFRQISEQEARRYWASGEPCDKAGSYAIQGFGAVFVERIEGSYSAVVGLPLYETAAMLERFGIHRWQSLQT